MLGGLNERAKRNGILFLSYLKRKKFLRNFSYQLISLRYLSRSCRATLSSSIQIFINQHALYIFVLISSRVKSKPNIPSNLTLTPRYQERNMREVAE